MRTQVQRFRLPLQTVVGRMPSHPPQVGVVPGGPAALTAAVAVERSPGGPGILGHTAVSPDGHSFTSGEARP